MSLWQVKSVTAHNKMPAKYLCSSDRVHLRGLWLEGIPSMVTAIPLRSSYLITLMLTVTTFTMYIQFCVYRQGRESIQDNTTAARKSLEKHSHFMGLHCMTSVQNFIFCWQWIIQWFLVNDQSDAQFFLCIYF